MIVEICANSFESAKAAQEGGADRIELCTELSVGGLTPSYGLLKKVTNELQIPVHVLIRPRSANFNYTQAELEVMLNDIELCRSLGCAGIVSGALTKEYKIDEAFTQKLIDATGQMEFTFHRAFDWCTDPLAEITTLCALGVTRVLSSGQQNTAASGITLLQEMLEASKGCIQIMPGGGIDETNCTLFKEAGFKMIHLSATNKAQTLRGLPSVSMHAPRLFEEGVRATSNAVRIAAVVKKVAC